MLNTGYLLKKYDYEYKIIEMLGRGANTIAYLAEKRRNGLVSKCILKEYSPDKTLTDEEFENGKLRFIASGRTQNDIRQLSVLNNQTPPVSHIFEIESPNISTNEKNTLENQNKSAFIDVACYNGTTLNKMTGLSLLEYMEIIRTIANTIGYYHQAGYLCLDIKPENIFVMQNAPGDTVTQLVEFIDFDSIRKRDEITSDTVISCTKDWAAPELLNTYAVSNIGPKTDIYTTGELIFYYLFGRHSTETEHRGFSKYPFGECRKEYLKYSCRPDICSVFSKIFRGTIRSSASNRFNDIIDVIHLLDNLIETISRKDYVIPKLPAVSPNFIGRDKELTAVTSNLKENNVLFLSGIGGIGKSTIIRNYINLNKSNYDVIIYLEYDGDIRRSFADDMQLQISTVHRTTDESTDEYFERKLKSLKEICTDKRVLFVIDNYSGKITKDLNLIFDCGYDTVLVTRNAPPKNSFNVMTVEAIAETSHLLNLITLNLERPITKEEQNCFEEIIGLVHGHTLTVELITRQIAKGRISINQALKVMREYGFTQISDEKISNYKDGEEVYDTLSSIITALFDIGNMPHKARLILKVLALLDVKGMDREIIKDIVKLDMDMIYRLGSEGWLYDGNVIRLHPVIAETLRNRSWDDILLPDEGSTPYDITVMNYHKDIADIYAGCGNADQLNFISKEAEKYSLKHPRHIIKAIYHDIRCSYYDILSTEYVPESKEEAEPLINMINEMDEAVYEAEQSTDSQQVKLLPRYYISLAGILIRSTPDGGEESSELLKKAYEIIEKNEPEYSDNHCYYNMINAWYYTLIEPDPEKTLYYTAKAKDIAFKVFPTEIEIIDIIYIPTANCMFFHNELQAADQIIVEAISLCEKHPRMLRYIEKHLDLMIIRLNIYTDLKDQTKCRELISEIKKMNDTYREQGIYRELPASVTETVL